VRLKGQVVLRLARSRTTATIVAFVSLSSLEVFAQSNAPGVRSDPISAAQFVSQSIVPPGTASASLRIYFVTNRAVSGSKSKMTSYSSTGTSTPLAFGTSIVSIPRDHRMGALENASIFRLFRNDPNRDVTVLSVIPEDRNSLLKAVASQVKKSKTKAAMVFIHGFNVTFEDSLRRTAQLAYDLGFDGAPIAFSWPSGQVPTPMLILGRDYTNSAYAAAEETAERTAILLADLLDEVRKRTGSQTIHLIAHSLGGRLLTKAIAAADAGRSPAFHEIVLAAPDIDAELFKGLAHAYKSAATRVTLYASSRDRALEISAAVHGGHPRAGESGERMVILPGVDTIDATNVDTSFDGHSYYGENRSIISDIFYLLRFGVPPDARFSLMPASTPFGTYWVFKR
jgi:esterase/lipase superfamily enzyme